MNIVDPLAYRESAFVRSAFNHATRTIVSEYSRAQAGERSLYFRDPVTRLYERLMPPDEHTSYGSPVGARVVPYAWFNVKRYAPRSAWLHVARVDIVTRRIDIVFSADDVLRATGSDPAWPIRPWVSELISVSDDGAFLVCQVGVPRVVRAARTA